MRFAILNRKGMSLVEVMVALVVLLFVSIALMQTALVSIDANMRNSIRDAVVGVAQSRLNEARNLTWNSTTDNLVSESGASAITLPACSDDQECLCKAGEGCTVGNYDSGFPVEVARHIRNLTVQFGTRRVVSDVDATDRQVTIVVRAVYRDRCYSHVSSTIIGKR